MFTKNLSFAGHSTSVAAASRANKEKSAARRENTVKPAVAESRVLAWLGNAFATWASAGHIR